MGFNLQISVSVISMEDNKHFKINNYRFSEFDLASFTWRKTSSFHVFSSIENNSRRDRYGYRKGTFP
jgi:hypothetical protein